MFQVAVIGAGQLGSRHLQALCKMPVSCSIHVIDLSTAALDAARTQLAGTAYDTDSKKVCFADNFESLPVQLDYVVLATTSSARLPALRSLLARSSVKHMILEKVLFDRTDSYPKALDLITNAGAKAWVNCTRREYPVYQQLAQTFRGQEILDFSVTGGAWGLGCNSIHFIDLLSFLSGATELEQVSTAALDPGTIPSKRPGYIEFCGELTGRFRDGPSFSLTSTAHAMRRLIQVRAADLTAIIDEQAGQLYMVDEARNGELSHSAITIPYTSEIMTPIGATILTQGECRLPTLAESSALHVPLQAALSTHAGLEDGHCPIT